MQRQNYQEVKLLDKQHLLEHYIIHEVKEITNDIRDLPVCYRVMKQNFKHATEEHVWGSSIIQILKGDEVLCEFVRNYPSFNAIFVEQNGIDFIVTSGDYQCITIVNLNNGEIKSYVDVDDKKHGCGFCPIYFDWDEDTLYVEGCIWACPYETMIARNIDLLNPTAAFNSADWEDDYDDYEEDDDWDDDDSDCYCE